MSDMNACDQLLLEQGYDLYYTLVMISTFLQKTFRGVDYFHFIWMMIHTGQTCSKENFWMDMRTKFLTYETLAPVLLDRIMSLATFLQAHQRFEWADTLWNMHHALTTEIECRALIAAIQQM